MFKFQNQCSQSFGKINKNKKRSKLVAQKITKPLMALTCLYLAFLYRTWFCLVFWFSFDRYIYLQKSKPSQNQIMAVAHFTLLLCNKENKVYGDSDFRDTTRISSWHYTKIRKEWTNSCSTMNHSVQYHGIHGTFHFLSNGVYCVSGA